MRVGDAAAGAAGFLGCLLMLAIGLLTIGMGYTGIAEEFGIGWGVAALGAGIVFRFTLPLVVGVFFFVTNQLDWHWSIAVLICAPGLVFMIPGLVMEMIKSARN